MFMALLILYGPQGSSFSLFKIKRFFVNEIIMHDVKLDLTTVHWLWTCMNKLLVPHRLSSFT